jgi:hypothetical protein
MWEPRSLTTLRGSTASYKDSFTLRYISDYIIFRNHRYENLKYLITRSERKHCSVPSSPARRGLLALTAQPDAFKCNVQLYATQYGTRDKMEAELYVCLQWTSETVGQEQTAQQRVVCSRPKAREELTDGKHAILRLVGQKMDSHDERNIRDHSSAIRFIIELRRLIGTRNNVIR